MEQITLEKVLTAARELSMNERRLLRAHLDQELREQDQFRSIEEIAREQGTRPLKFEEMVGDFWPEEENVDDFINTVREWRQLGYKVKQIDQ